MIMKKCSHLLCLIFQQECEELARKVADLTTENSALRAELDNLRKACQDMEAENSRLLVSTVSFAILFHHHLLTLLLPRNFLSCQHDLTLTYLQMVEWLTPRYQVSQPHWE